MRKGRYIREKLEDRSEQLGESADVAAEESGGATEQEETRALHDAQNTLEVLKRQH